MNASCKAANNNLLELQQGSIDDIVRIVFSKPVQPPKSIQFQLEDDSADPKKLQDICHYIAVKGIMKLYDTTNMLQVDRAQAETIASYMASIGVKMHITCNMTDSSPYDLLDRGEPVQSIQLKYTFL